MIKINSYNDLLEYAEKCLRDEKFLGDFELDSALDYSIKIKGDSWDGSIDYRLAQYILDTQKKIDDIFKEMGIEFAEEDRPIVKFKIEAGCTEIFVHISDTLKALFQNMTSGQKTVIAALIVLALVGGFTIYEIKEYKVEQERLAHELEQQEQANEKEVEIYRELADITESVIEKIPEYTKPNKRLAKNLRPGDVVENSINHIPLTKEEFKRKYPGKSKYKPETVYLDGTYLITAIKLDSGKITIEHGPYRYDCLSSLNEKESKDLFSRLQAAHAAKKGIELPLKITSKYYKGSMELRDLIIYEIGPPREGARTIESLIEK